MKKIKKIKKLKKANDKQGEIFAIYTTIKLTSQLYLKFL